MKPLIRIAKPKMQPREWKLVAITLLCAGLFGFKTFVLKKRAALNLVKIENTALEGSVQNTKNTLAQMQIAAAGRSATPNDQGQAAILEKNNNFSSLLNRLSGDGIQFSLERLTVDEHKEVAGYSRTLFNLEIETSFIELGKFIEGLENSDFLVDFQSVEISRIDKELKRSKAKIKVFSYASRGAQ
jgi:hypothetical protein